MEYEPVIGLEVHVQLKTKTKMFTRAPYAYGQAPNTCTNPVVMGLPGTLPVINYEGLRKVIQAGLMFDCEIAEICKWDRKNYCYPDLPKSYQISQYDQPICIGGLVEIELPGPSRNIMGEHRKIKLTRIHLEEDAGKLTHYENDSLADYNRAGVCLAEIVTDPDLYSADEAFAFLTSIRTNMVYADISDCDMEKGQMRCDANISVRPKGSSELGVKVEIKNLNTISGVRNGIEYEIKRQIAALKKGETIVQETRRWNAEKGFTTPMRSKEEASDYCYFPDPDLMPVKMEKEYVDKLFSALPERPFDKQRRFYEQYDLPYTVTSVICPDKNLSSYFEEALETYNKPKPIANIIVNDLLRELGAVEMDGSLPLSECKIKPKHIAQLVQLVDEGTISKQISKDVFMEMFQTGKEPATIVEEKGLKQTSDTSELEEFCREAIKNNPKPVAEYRSGKENAINALKGPVMKATRGQANPNIIDELLRKILSES